MTNNIETGDDAHSPPVAQALLHLRLLTPLSQYRYRHDMKKIPNAILKLEPELRTRLNPIWMFGVNTCHAPLWLRDDLNQHLALARQELGFVYVRAHGTLGDNIGTIDDKGNFNFTVLIQGLERLLEHGYKPFFELSHMPSGIASNEECITQYRFRSAPPKDWKRWAQIVSSLVETLAGRFGLSELRRWYFEVWNEPDIRFWSGTQPEYFQLYDVTADAIKRVDPELRVGGPATSKTAWIDDFLAHITRPSADFTADASRCDFISTHAYPSDLAFLDAAHGEVALQNSYIMSTLFSEVRRKVDAALGTGFPVFCGEWNSSAGPLAENHDDCNNAAFVVKTLVELSDVCNGSLFWNLSDIYEECGFHVEPFHGGYGLITVNGIRKAAFHAFSLLNDHRGERVQVQIRNAPVGLGAFASADDFSLHLLIYYHREPGEAQAASCDVELVGLPQGDVHVTTVRPGQGSAYETWLEAGKPPFVDLPLLNTLTAASQPKQSCLADGRRTVRVGLGTVVQVSCHQASPIA